MDNKLLGLLGIGVAAYLLLNKKKDETVAIVSNTEPTLPPIDPTVPSLPPLLDEPIFVPPLPTPGQVVVPGSGNIIVGCMDPNSITYNPLANSEPDILDANGFPLCQYGDPYTEVPADVLGCVDPNSSTYNPLATLDDGSCFYPPAPILGCTDPQALNFDYNATSDNGTCAYNPPPMPIAGCMDPSALNYDSLAVADDGSCQYPPVQIVGCTDPLADNYNPNATVGCSTSPNSGNVVTNVNTGVPYSSGFDGTFMIGDY